MNANHQIVRQWEEQEALHRFQLISPLLDSELRETQTTNYFSVFQRIDRAVWELMAD